MTGLVKISHEGASEWVHPAVAELFRTQGPSVFNKGALADADAAAARDARNKAKRLGGTTVGRVGVSDGGRPNGKEVLNTLRLLEDQIKAMVEGGGVCGA